MPAIRDEVVNLALKYFYYKGLWENRFTDLKNAYALGYQEFTSHLPRAHRSSVPQDVIEDIGEMGANMFVAHLALSGSPAVVAVPIVLIVKKLLGLLSRDGNVPNVDVTAVKTSLSDIEKAFKDATEYMGGLVTRLHDKVISLPVGATYDNNDDFQFIRTIMSKILLSPPWFPPSKDVTEPNRMKRPFEMRLWFIYWKHLQGIKMYDDLGALDLSPMFNHLNAIGSLPSGFTWKKVTYKHLTQPRFAQQDVYDGMNYREAIDFLLDYYLKNNGMALKIPHKFPPEVEKYLQKVSVLRGITMVNPAVSDHLLAPATMDWADVAAWQP